MMFVAHTPVQLVQNFFLFFSPKFMRCSLHTGAQTETFGIQVEMMIISTLTRYSRGNDINFDYSSNYSSGNDINMDCS